MELTVIISRGIWPEDVFVLDCACVREYVITCMQVWLRDATTCMSVCTCIFMCSCGTSPEKRCASQHHILSVGAWEQARMAVCARIHIPLFPVSRVCAERPSFKSSPSDVNSAMKGHYLDFRGESVGKCRTHCIWTAQTFIGGLIGTKGLRRLRVKTTLMVWSLYSSVRKSCSNYVLIILREFKSRRTLWKSVYPAAA